MHAFRKILGVLTAIGKDRSGAVASEDAVAVSLAMLCGLVAFAAVGIMPADVVDFAITSFGGAFELVS